MEIIFALFSFLLGAVVGSFSNVCILRIPKNESVVFPPSHCPVCNENIRWYDNIPIFSWFILKGKCRKCGEKISLLYPLIEFISGVIYFFNFYFWGVTPYFLVFSFLCSSFLIMALIDYEHKILPDIITLPGIIAGFLTSLITGHITIIESFIGFLTGGGLFFLIAVISRGGMGGGDIKLMAMIGAFLGWQDVLLTTFIGSFTGSVVGGGLMLVGKKRRKDQIPFGPFLVFGATLSLYWGREIVEWYFMVTRLGVAG